MLVGQLGLGYQGILPVARRNEQPPLAPKSESYANRLGLPCFAKVQSEDASRTRLGGVASNAPPKVFQHNGKAMGE
jgi:hypothetical protein